MQRLLKNDAVIRFLGGFAAGCLLMISAANGLFNGMV